MERESEVLRNFSILSGARLRGRTCVYSQVEIERERDGERKFPARFRAQVGQSLSEMRYSRSVRNV